MNRKVDQNFTCKAYEKTLVTMPKTQTFSSDKNFKKRPHLLTLIFIPFQKCSLLLCKAMPVCNQL